MPTDNLPRLLLKLLDDLPAPTVSAKTLAAYNAAQVKDLQRRRILRPMPEVTMLDECGSCDIGCMGRAVTNIAGKTLALCPTSYIAPLEIDPLELKHFEIDEKETCRQLRQGNGLEGAEIELLTNGLWRIGGKHEGALVFVAFRVNERTAASVSGAMMVQTQLGSCELWLPDETRLPFAVREQFLARNVIIHSITGVLVSDAVHHPLQLHIPEAPETPSIARPKLVIHVSGMKAAYNGNEVKLASTPFSLLRVMTLAAKQQEGYIRRDELEKRVWGCVSSSRVLEQNISRLRKSFGEGMGKDFDPESLIENKQTIGYRLCLLPEEIEIIE